MGGHPRSSGALDFFALLQGTARAIPSRYNRGCISHGLLICCGRVGWRRAIRQWGKVGWWRRRGDDRLLRWSKRDCRLYRWHRWWWRYYRWGYQRFDCSRCGPLRLYQHHHSALHGLRHELLEHCCLHLWGKTLEGVSRGDWYNRLALCTPCR